jgi:hypothetical protein
MKSRASSFRVPGIRSLAASWTLWSQTRKLKRQVRHLERMSRRQALLLQLHRRKMELMDQLQHPPALMQVPSQPQTVTPEELEPPIPTLTEEEIRMLESQPRPEPVDLIRQRLDLL